MKLFLLTSALSVLLLAGCGSAAKRAALPVAQNVCFELRGIEGDEGAFTKRRAAQYLAESGFRPATTDCDVTMRFNVIEAFKWEQMQRGFFGGLSQSAAWRMGGLVTISRGGVATAEDIALQLSDYGSKLDLLDAVGSRATGVLQQYYRPEAKPK